jgi:adenosylcobinamide kinase / adenosylcobinamide-phosphate guanylyltransferase
MAHLSLILGGIRSGKSEFAERLAQAYRPVVYLATAFAGDEEMARRIVAHRQRRPPEWHTVESPWDVADAIERHGAGGCLLLDSVTLWLSNLMLGMTGHLPLPDQAITARVDDAIARAAQVRARLLVVSDEVGWGGIPADPLARRFGNLLGDANQRIAAAAEEVHLCVAGQTMKLK